MRTHRLRFKSIGDRRVRRGRLIIGERTLVIRGFGVKDQRTIADLRRVDYMVRNTGTARLVLWLPDGEMDLGGIDRPKAKAAARILAGLIDPDASPDEAFKRT